MIRLKKRSGMTKVLDCLAYSSEDEGSISAETYEFVVGVADSMSSHFLNSQNPFVM